jgi:hypothetical protein
MQALATLSDFLESSGYRVQIYDMGRRVIPLSRDDFRDFERTRLPYPLPLRRQAWFGLLFHHRDESTAASTIWFLHFPLDEQAKLVLAARDDFMRQLLAGLGETADPAVRKARIEAALQDNPYAFRPKPERMAVLHARVTASLQQPASQYYAHACDYFSGRLGWDQWSFLGYQGIADLAARLEQDDNRQRIKEAIPELPAAPLEALCHCLENVPVPADIASALLHRTQSTLQQFSPDPQILSACMRGIACSRATELRQRLFDKVLSHSLSRRGDLLVAISGRAWEALADHKLRERFLERLAENDQGKDFFDNVLNDLLYLPGTRQELLTSLKGQGHSKRLGKAIESFFAKLKSTGD